MESEGADKMSHTYDLECANCNVKFCQCHEYIIKDTPDGDRVVLCDKYCKDEYEAMSQQSQ